jgi:hypothetical protein
VVAPRAVEIAEVQGKAQQAAQELFLVRVVLDVGPRLFETRSCAGLVTAIEKEPPERKNGDGVLGSLRNGTLVSRRRTIVLRVVPVNSRERDEGRVMLGTGLFRSSREIFDQLVERPVPLAIELHEPFERERFTRPPEREGRIARDEGGARCAFGRLGDG